MAQKSKILEVKEAVEKKLLHIPGVNAVAIGLKQINGKPSNEPSIAVFVSKKKPLFELSSEEILPSTINEFKTDVIESGKITITKTSRYKGSMHIEGNGWGGGTRGGTLGCFAWTREINPRPVLLTNQHTIMHDRNSVTIPDAGSEAERWAQTWNLTTVPPGGDVGPRICSICSTCCSKIIAKILRVVLTPEVDGAVAVLKPGINWLREVEEIGTVTGTHPITDQEVCEGCDPYMVQMRGAATGRVMRGRVAHIHYSGVPAFDDKGEIHRPFVSNQLRIEPEDSSEFSVSGDSGSIILNNNREVVGLHFGGVNRPFQPSYGAGLACPIDAVENQLQIDIATTNNPGEVLQASGETNPTGATTATRQPILGGNPVAIEQPQLLMHAYEEVLKTSDGKKLYKTFRKNEDEVRDLIHTNRRVATVWHRSGGPAILNMVVHAVENPDFPFPNIINGCPLAECVQKISSVLTKYGSIGLRSDIDKFGSAIVQLGGMSYSKLMATLQTESILKS